MGRRTQTAIITIVLFVAIVVMTCCGMLLGLRRDWGGMAFFFFLAVHSAECSICVLLNHKIESRFMQLAEHVTGKYESDRLVRQFGANSVIILNLIFIVVIFLLLILACKREWEIVLCILLAQVTPL